MQAFGDVQATLARTAMEAPEGLGVGWMRHLTPFHRSARVRPPPVWPTAVQAEAEVHDTPFSVPPLGGFCVASMRHRAPLRRSASVLPLAVAPTAMHADLDAQYTLFSTPPPGGLGIVWMRQALPFHCSANVCWERSSPVVAAPTAMQSVCEMHAVPLSWLEAAPSGLGAV